MSDMFGRLRSVILGVIVAAAASTLPAQVGSASITGVVTDATQAPIPASAITIVNTESGTVLNAVFYFLFLAALSWTEVTVALPMTAIEYGFAALLAVLILKEQVPAGRWFGIALVMMGVILISKTGGET